MKNTDSPAKLLDVLTQAQALWRMPRRSQPNPTPRTLRTLKRACRLLICLMLVCQGFVFNPGAVATAQSKLRKPSVLDEPQPQPLPQRLPSRPQRRLPKRQALKAEAPQISTGALIDLEIQRNPQAFSVARAGRVKSAPAISSSPPVVADEPNPLAPALGITFDAINFNEDANLNGFFHIPPDPAGAAGPNHVVNVVNTSIEWYTKAGVRQNRQALFNFFAGAPTPPQTNTFDPKVIYDQYENRFVVVTMERIEASGMIPNQSRVYLAVSDDSDPNGTWFFQTLLTEETIVDSMMVARQSWADFPGLAVDSEAVYFTTNMFAHNNQPNPSTFRGQRLWIMAKAPWYTGGTPVANRFDPAALASANPAGDAFALATTMQPTQMYGDTPGGLGTFLIAYSGINDGTNLFVQIVQVDNPLSMTPTFTGYFSQWGTIAANDNTALGFPGAPQLGTTRTIATNDRRFSQHGIHRNGLLYCAAPIRPPAAAPVDGGQVTVRYFILDPAVILAGGAATDPPPVDQGNIGGEDIAPGTFTFFPSVAVDMAGNLAIGFAASAPSIFPGAYFTGRLAADPPTTTRAAGGLRAGRDFYIRDFTTSMTVASRWGDYSGIWLDPSDNLTFWVFNEYALPRGTLLGGLPEEDGRWGNAWGSFSLAAMAMTNAGQVIISEFRLRGPAGLEDEFIELYNNTDAAITVNDVNPLPMGTSGWALVSADDPLVAKAVVPTGTTIPARGHYLIANNTMTTGYSLGGYPSGNNGLAATTATPDRTYTTNIPDNRGIALFRSANPANYTLADRLDAVGSASETNALFKEGTGYPDLGPFGPEYSFLRTYCPSNMAVFGSARGCFPGSGGLPKDTDNNAADFMFADTNGTSIGAGQLLGAPGPENLTSPIQRNNAIGTLLLDPCVGGASPPNRVRDFTPVTNGSQGTLSIRRTFTNNTGGNVTRLRYRVVDITTFPAPPGIADLRVLTSSDVVVTVDRAPCGSGTSNVTVRGTTLEQPPTQLNGGGFNSSLSAGTITLATPLANGASVDVQFLLGVVQTGAFRFFINVEALP